MKRLIKSIVLMFIKILRLDKPIIFYLWVGSQINRILKVDGIIFDANTLSTYYRAKTLLTKEPETILWMDTFIKEDDTVYDIGANVGIYSLYSAIKRKARVLSFEPESSNYVMLNRNIYINKISNIVTAYNIALHNENKLSLLHLGEVRTGASGHTFDDKEDMYHQEFTPEFSQGVVGFTLDSFIEQFDVPFPNHIKIDVDGNEDKIFEGMQNTLKDERLKSVLVELYVEGDRHKKVLEEFENLGYKIFFATSRKQGNVIFSRESISIPNEMKLNHR